MLLEIDNIFWETVKKEFRHFKSFCYDENYKLFNSYDDSKFETLFLYSMTDNNKVMKNIKKNV